MERNFRLDHISAIRFHDRTIDLHNAYDLDGFCTTLSGNEAALRFIRNGHAIRSETLPLRVELRCTGNVGIAFNDLGAINAPFGRHNVEIAYFDSSCDWSSFTDEAIAARQEPDGLHVCLAGDLVIRIYCDKAMIDFA